MLGRRGLHSSCPRFEQKASLPRYNVQVGPLQLNRLEEYYNTTLARDLLYMTYQHPTSTSAAEDAAEVEESTNTITRSWDPASPYSQNRPTRANRGNRVLQASSNPDELVQLDRVIITAFSKEAITNKHNLIPLLAQMRAITGKPILGSLADPNATSLADLPKEGYIKILKSKSGSSSFKLRPGMPVGVQAVLPMKSGYEFLEVFTTFVLPRLRSFNGFLLPPGSQPRQSPAAMSGVVSLGMGPDAISLFPQTEVNWDSYPNRGVGFQVSNCTAGIRRLLRLNLY
jgi:large subunit ribosomal protein L5